MLAVIRKYLGCDYTQERFQLSTDDKDALDKVTNIVYGSPTKMNEIEIIQCKDWNEFQLKVKFTDRPFLNRVFRGLSNSQWTLKSKWDRYREQKSKYGNDTARACRNDTPESFLDAFKEFFIGNASFDTSTLSEEQWMALGRHHGLITPLLDWTKSPYVAAYFAFRDYLPMEQGLGCINPTPVDCDDGNVAIWEIPLKSVLSGFGKFQVVYTRTDSANRQKAQSGLFTLLSPEIEMTLDEFLKTKNYQHIIHKYLIPKTDALIVMHDLHLMNINEGTMFPDADGAAKQANLGKYMDWVSLLEQNR